MQTEAGLKLQFGHGGEAVEIASDAASADTECEGFNSATAVKPWRYAQIAASTLPADRFNSATAVKPWRCLVRLARPIRIVRFNSATAVKPWR